MLNNKNIKLKSFSLLALLAMSSSAFASVTLTVPSTVDLLVVNGQTPETSTLDKFFSNNEKQVELPDGWNQIVFEYHPQFNQGNGDDLVLIDTDTIVAKFNASQTELTFDLPKYRNEREARTFDQNPDWKLVNKNGQTVEVTQDKLLKGGIQLGRDYKEEIQSYNQKGGSAAVILQEPVAKAAPASAPVVSAAPVAATAAATTAVVSNTSQASTTSQTSAPVVKSSGNYKNTEEEMLHYWYQKADAETKQRFIREILN